jgi:branched-chain amino acid transport system ATP-binding protein
VRRRPARRPMLSVENLISAYGRIEVLHGVSLDVRAGEIVALIGANGAGKTTLLRALSGVQPISAGTIRFDDRPIERLPAHARVALGLTQVPEGRQLFAPLSVDDNLRLGAWTRVSAGTRRSGDVADDLARAYALFPLLQSMRERPAGALSGGQQQMLAVGRALMARPRMLLLDEPSLGLAPQATAVIFDTLVALKRAGLTILLVEQNAAAALAIADRAYVLETGRIALSGVARDLADDRRVREAYLGV